MMEQCVVSIVVHFNGIGENGRRVMQRPWAQGKGLPSPCGIRGLISGVRHWLRCSNGVNHEKAESWTCSLSHGTRKFRRHYASARPTVWDLLNTEAQPEGAASQQGHLLRAFIPTCTWKGKSCTLSHMAPFTALVLGLLPRTTEQWARVWAPGRGIADSHIPSQGRIRMHRINSGVQRAIEFGRFISIRTEQERLHTALRRALLSPLTCSSAESLIRRMVRKNAKLDRRPLFLIDGLLCQSRHPRLLCMVSTAEERRVTNSASLRAYFPSYVSNGSAEC